MDFFEQYSGQDVTDKDTEPLSESRQSPWTTGVVFEGFTDGVDNNSSAPTTTTHSREAWATEESESTTAPETDGNSEGWREFQRLHTHTLFYLAQVSEKCDGGTGVVESTDKVNLSSFPTLLLSLWWRGDTPLQ